MEGCKADWLVLILVASLSVAGSSFAQSTAGSEEPPESATENQEQGSRAGDDEAEPEPQQGDRAKPAKKAPADSPLVRAAREGSKNRGKAKIRITDEDVKKSKGKLIIVSGTPVPEQPEPNVEPSEEPSSMEQLAEERKREAEEAEGHRREIEQTRTRIRELEAELAKIEEAYLDEDDDFAYRDEFLMQRFEQAKIELEEVRATLVALEAENP